MPDQSGPRANRSSDTAASRRSALSLADKTFVLDSARSSVTLCQHSATAHIHTPPELPKPKHHSNQLQLPTEESFTCYCLHSFAFERAGGAALLPGHFLCASVFPSFLKPDPDKKETTTHIRRRLNFCEVCLAGPGQKRTDPLPTDPTPTDLPTSLSMFFSLLFLGVMLAARKSEQPQMRPPSRQRVLWFVWLVLLPLWAIEIGFKRTWLIFAEGNDTITLD